MKKFSIEIMRNTEMNIIKIKKIKIKMKIIIIKSKCVKLLTKVRRLGRISSTDEHYSNFCRCSNLKFDGRSIIYFIPWRPGWLALLAGWLAVHGGKH